MPEDESRKRTSRQFRPGWDVGFGKFPETSCTPPRRGAVISLGVGEPDFKTPEHISEAGYQAVKRGCTGYSPERRLPELKAAIASDLVSRYGVSYEPETEIMVTVAPARPWTWCCAPSWTWGDEVVIPDPHYICYPPVIAVAHGRPVPVATRLRTSSALRPTGWRPAITPKTRGVLFGYPANPTGTEMGRAGAGGGCRGDLRGEA